jgi:hypothetical protein
MSTATLITARVKYGAGQPRETQYGMRINALLTLPDGTEHRVWGKPEDRAIASLKKGQQVQLLHDGKGYKLVADNQPAQVKQLVATELTPEQKRAAEGIRNEIAEYVTGQANLLKFCWTTAAVKLGGIATEEESIRCAAASLYIAAQRKFNF